jgi:hypothetical protein
MIIKDFFRTLEKLDAFILGLQHNEMTKIEDGVLKVFQYERIVTNGKYSVLIFGLKRLKTTVQLPTKKKYHHH